MSPLSSSEKKNTNRASGSTSVTMEMNAVAPAPVDNSDNVSLPDVEAGKPESARSAMSDANRSMSSIGRMKSKIGSILISSLPINLRKSVDDLKLDVNGDGRLDTDEIIMAVDNLASKVKDNVGLKRMIWVLCSFAVLLIGCVFGASITAARLAKDTELDVSSGIMYTKGIGSESSLTTMKTEDVVIYNRTTKIAEMTNDELRVLKEILLMSGDLKFQVKGYARGSVANGDGKQVKLLVEGGTITYDLEGVVSATGDAQELLDFAYSVEDVETDEEVVQEGTTRGRRYLQSTQSDGGTTETGSGSGASNEGRGSSF